MKIIKKKLNRKLKEFDYKRTICLDETSIPSNMSLTYGRSKSETRVIKRQINVLTKDIICYVL